MKTSKSLSDRLSSLLAATAQWTSLTTAAALVAAFLPLGAKGQTNPVVNPNLPIVISFAAEGTGGSGPSIAGTVTFSMDGFGAPQDVSYWSDYVLLYTNLNGVIKHTLETTNYCYTGFTLGVEQHNQAYTGLWDDFCITWGGSNVLALLIEFPWGTTPDDSLNSFLLMAEDELPQSTGASILYGYDTTGAQEWESITTFSITNVAPPSPALTIKPSPSGMNMDMALSWPTNDGSGYQLQQCSSVLQPNWSPVTNTPVLGGGLYTVTIPFNQSNRSMFFSLQKTTN
jgi:hypothetical protein